MNNKNSQTKLLLRNAILIQLEAASPASLPSDILSQGLTIAGHNIQQENLTKNLEYLTDKNLIKKTIPNLSTSLIRFALTASGLDYLEQEGLA